MSLKYRWKCDGCDRVLEVVADTEADSYPPTWRRMRVALGAVMPAVEAGTALDYDLCAGCCCSLRSQANPLQWTRVGTVADGA